MNVKHGRGWPNIVVNYITLTSADDLEGYLSRQWLTLKCPGHQSEFDVLGVRLLARELSSGSTFCIQSLCPSCVNVEIVVMSDPTTCSPSLLVKKLLFLVIATNSTGTNSIPSSRGPSQTKVGGAMNTNSPPDLGRWGFSDPIVCASLFFHLLMAIEGGERFHVQHAYATPSGLSYFKRRSNKWLLPEWDL